MGIEIVPHPRVQYTDRRLISVDEDGFGTGRPVVPLSRFPFLLPVSRFLLESCSCEKIFVFRYHFSCFHVEFQRPFRLK
jgi:hypothetical protein